NVFYRNRHRRDMPIVTVFVLKRRAMTCSIYKTLWFGGERIDGRIPEWPKRFIGQVIPICVTLILCSRRRILIVILAIMFGHPWRFGPWTLCAGIVIPGPFPTMYYRIAFKTI